LRNWGVIVLYIICIFENAKSIFSANTTTKNPIFMKLIRLLSVTVANVCAMN